jgi:phosphatidylserine/phosphatidylglycerophosphate/cardiolipin synthase-like enzyme
MGAFRDGAFRQLIAADTYKRLRLMYPIASRSRDVPTFVHSKVMIVDDVLARIGSANFSHRSMGMDTECDLAVDAGGDPDARAGVLRVGTGFSQNISACQWMVWPRASSAVDRFARESAEHTLVPESKSQKKPRHIPKCCGLPPTRMSPWRLAPRSNRLSRRSRRRAGAILSASGFCLS